MCEPQRVVTYDIAQKGLTHVIKKRRRGQPGAQRRSAKWRFAAEPLQPEVVLRRTRVLPQGREFGVPGEERCFLTNRGVNPA